MTRSRAKTPRIRPIRGVAAVMLGLWVGLAGCSAEDSQPADKHPLDGVLTMHHAQVKGTHNSYHRKPKHPGMAWNYELAPLDVQLGAQGVRQFELDLYWSAADADYRVFHFPVVDAETTCATLTVCLQTIKGWSDSNREHLPIQVWLEPKDNDDPTGAIKPYGRIEDALLAVFGRERLVIPDDVRGASKDLATAVQAGGWPTLGQARGKVMAVMLDNGTHRDAYANADPTLAGRLIFAEGGLDRPWGVIGRIDGPVGGEAAIKAEVGKGRMIRTRADNGSVEAEAKDYGRLEAALRSGAHAISTDHPAKGADYDFVVEIPGGTPARCNPITAPPQCTSAALESLAGVAGKAAAK